MKIKYKFATGEVTEVEVSDEIGAVITASCKAEHALEERNRYHCYSLDAMTTRALSTVSAMSTPSRTIPQNRRNASKPLSASSLRLSSAAFACMQMARH